MTEDADGLPDTGSIIVPDHGAPTISAVDARGDDLASAHRDAIDADADAAAWVPDDIDLVTEVADMMSIFAAQRLERIDALRRHALADADRYGGGLVEIIERSVRLELASALRVTENAAGGMLMLAEALVHRYPSALASLGRAGMTELHAAVFAELLDTVEPELRGIVTARALELAETLPVGSFRRGLRKLVDTVRAITLAERHEEALKERRVVIEPADDGMAWLSAFVPAVEAHAIHGRLTAIGKVIRAADGDTRTLDQVRADVFGDLLIDGDTTTHPKQARGIRAIVTVTVPVLSLLEDHPSRTGTAGTPASTGCTGSSGTSATAGIASSTGPAVVEGVGPIPLDRARQLCGSANDWMRVLTHPETGTVLSVGRDHYRPPPDLRRLVRWRAERCMAPGCGVPASRCQLDHTVAWEHGGHTALNNLAPLCQGHHTVKHHGGWRVRQFPDSGGAIEWTSPTGRVYTVSPERRVPSFS